MRFPQHNPSNTNIQPRRSGKHAEITGQVQINGLTDPTYRFVQHGRGGHSIGMALDLGFSRQFITAGYQISDHDQAAPTIVGSGWSIQNAITWSNLLTADHNNNQAGALRNFLSLYALTIRDEIANNGTWENLPIVNGEQVRTALFGSGDQNARQMVQHVWIGDTRSHLNSYQAMRFVLSRLGFNSNNGLVSRPTVPHPDHFHVDIRPPQRLELESYLLSGVASEQNTRNISLSDLQGDYRELLAYVVSEAGANQGELKMFVDLPVDLPPSLSQIPAFASTQNQWVADIPQTIGLCEIIEWGYESYFEAGFDLDTLLYTVGSYISHSGGKRLSEDDFLNGKITVLQMPSNGKLVDSRHFAGIPLYLPDDGFYGKVKLAALVEIGGYKVRVETVINVVPTIPLERERGDK